MSQSDPHGISSVDRSSGGKEEQDQELESVQLEVDLDDDSEYNDDDKKSTDRKNQEQESRDINPFFSNQNRSDYDSTDRQTAKCDSINQNVTEFELTDRQPADYESTNPQLTEHLLTATPRQRYIPKDAANSSGSGSSRGNRFLVGARPPVSRQQSAASRGPTRHWDRVKQYVIPLGVCILKVWF